MGVLLPALDVPTAELPDSRFLRHDLRLPELAQNEVIRYFLGLSKLNYNIDSGFYPLGSCTMKYNPKINEDVARLAGFANVHPLQEPKSAQGALRTMSLLQDALSEITGMDAVSLAPAAGAQGELCGILMIKAYLAERGESHRRTVLIPDSAHGTNPATAAMAGFDVVTVPSTSDGNSDIDFLRSALNNGVAAMMLTLPSTLGLFDPNIEQIAAMLHDHGALLYGDGANQNAFLGRARFGDIGFDVVHLNLHKTFSTPHGGGGPGAGPVCVKSHLAPYLPAPIVTGDEGNYRLKTPEHTIGKTMAFHGNFGVLVRALTYIRSLGADGLRAISENAVINANYVLVRLRDAYKLPYDRTCLHEVVLSGSRQKAASGVKTLDIAKRLIDYGFHPPTIYFPLIVDEALMIEPTEAEGKEALDDFCDAMLSIARESEEDPDIVKGAPHTAPLRRLDEATAARKPVLRWTPKAEPTS
ncbi:MAG: aminomethyl-transferring glycine dehydrogenase subunit GcvPB [Chloroflexi bacterium]|nr:aminomethyl-transferring glycine dehydrogenase subunit GcvPB [Chloroflexota bacterium]